MWAGCKTANGVRATPEEDRNNQIQSWKYAKLYVFYLFLLGAGCCCFDDETFPLLWAALFMLVDWTTSGFSQSDLHQQNICQNELPRSHSSNIHPQQVYKSTLFGCKAAEKKPCAARDGFRKQMSAWPQVPPNGSPKICTVTISLPFFAAGDALPRSQIHWHRHVSDVSNDEPFTDTANRMLYGLVEQNLFPFQHLFLAPQWINRLEHLHEFLELEELLEFSEDPLAADAKYASIFTIPKRFDCVFKFKQALMWLANSIRSNWLPHFIANLDTLAAPNRCLHSPGSSRTRFHGLVG